MFQSELPFPAFCGRASNPAKKTTAGYR